MTKNRSLVALGLVPVTVIALVGQPPVFLAGRPLLGIAQLGFLALPLVGLLYRRMQTFVAAS